MTAIPRTGIITHVLFAAVVLTALAGVAKGIATPEAPLAGAPAGAMQWPASVERDARLAPGIAPRTAAQLHAAIRSTDFTCDRISGARVNGLTGGFTVDCNHDAFSYEVWNRDGDWTAEPQR